MCWWCCMRVLEKCLPRNDIVRELAPYLQHVHRDDGGALDDDTRRGADAAGAWGRVQSPRGCEFTSYTDEKNSATSSDSFRHNPNAYLRASTGDDRDRDGDAALALDAKQQAARGHGHNHSQNNSNGRDRPTLDLAHAAPRSSRHPDGTLSNPGSAASNLSSGTSTAASSGFNAWQPSHSQQQMRVGFAGADADCARAGEMSGSDQSTISSLMKKSSLAKIKTDLGDLTPVPWEKVVIVQVSVQGFREMMGQAKDLMEEAKLLYEHTVLSRLASEYGGQEILSHSRSGLFVIAFASEFHAAKWCLSLQLSLVYAAWNEKLLKQFDDTKEVYATTNGKSKKKMLLYRGFRVRMVIHTADPDEAPDKSLSDAVKWTKTVSEYAHGGQIILSDSVWDRLKEQLVQLGNPVVEDLGCHAVLGDEVLLMLLLPRDLDCRRFPSLNSPVQLSLGMRDAPSAQKPVTMVFTFIEGARPLVRCHAEELADRVKTLCMVARELLRKHNGYECQELQGDFMLAFFNPAAAILWCGEFQLRIRQKFREWNRESENKELMFSMSMGIETGVPASVSPHKTSGRADYFGNIVNQTARIAKAAHGAQVLIGGDAWNAFSSGPYRSQVVLKSDTLAEVSGTTIFQFKSHGYYSFKGISQPIGLIEAIPIDLHSPMLKLELVTLARGRAPKAKHLDDAQLANQKKTPILNVPSELLRISHGGEKSNNSIRETEAEINLSWDDSIPMFEDIEESDNEDDDDDEGSMVCGSETLAMRASNLTHSDMLQMLRGSVSSSTGLTPRALHAEEIDRV